MSKCLWEYNRGKSNGHKTNIIKHNELLITDKTIYSTVALVLPISIVVSGVI